MTAALLLYVTRQIAGFTTTLNVAIIINGNTTISGLIGRTNLKGIGFVNALGIGDGIANVTFETTLGEDLWGKRKDLV